MGRRAGSSGVSILTDPLNGVSTTTYDRVGNVLTSIDPLGRTTSISYDALNRQVTATDALDGTITTTYDAVGNVLTTGLATKLPTALDA